MQTWFSEDYEEIALKLACWDKSIRVQKKKKLMRKAGETALKLLPSQPLKKEQRSTGSLQKLERANDWVLESRA